MELRGAWGQVLSRDRQGSCVSAQQQPLGTGLGGTTKRRRACPKWTTGTQDENGIPNCLALPLTPGSPAGRSPSCFVYLCVSTHMCTVCRVGRQSVHTPVCAC